MFVLHSFLPAISLLIVCVNLCAQFDNQLLVYVSLNCCFKLRLLNNHQAKTQRLFIYYHKCQTNCKILTFKKLEKFL